MRLNGLCVRGERPEGRSKPCHRCSDCGKPAFSSVSNDLEEHAAYALTAPWQASNRCANSGFIWQGTFASQSRPVTDNGVPLPTLPVKHAHRKPGIGSRLPR